ncbi:Chromosome II, complete genome, related [Eimeria brunetti]|uniref:Chromosome II, complete genome, related n=1 Tax=Eimeria brunetti TaxID=51314 RepID=U6LFV6_9EIME|nr:Chromosome II, complete genome, related [Eimeria brunetti]
MKFLAPVFLVGCVYTAGTAAEESALGTPTSVEDTVNGVKTTLNFAGKYTNSCFSVQNSLCFGGTEQIVSGNSVPEGLGAWLTFDHLYSADESGNGNHMHRTPRAGPAHNGVRGSQTYFPEELLSCDPRSEMSQTPSILLYPDSRRLSVRVTTDDSGSEGMPSTGSLPLRRWTHVAVTASQNRLKLFLNFLRGTVVPNTEDIVVGASIENPGFETPKRTLQDHEVAAMTMPALTGVPDAEFVSLGEIRSPNYHKGLVQQTDMYRMRFLWIRLRNEL